MELDEFGELDDNGGFADYLWKYGLLVYKYG